MNPANQVIRDEQDIECPFCHQKGFDLIGLKDHYFMGWCEVLNETEAIKR